MQCIITIIIILLAPLYKENIWQTPTIMTLSYILTQIKICLPLHRRLEW